MKHFLLLLLLTSWTHLGSSARRCKTGVVLSGHILNLKGSRLAKAEVEFLQAFNSSGLGECLEDCCSGKYGSCSIAAYKNKTEEFNCLHFYCFPLAKCKFLSAASVDSYAFPGSLAILDTMESETHSGNSYGLLTAKTLRDKERSVIPRKGVENLIITRKGVASAMSHLYEPAVKNDNTTVKPRKGVTFFPMHEATMDTSVPTTTTTTTTDASFQATEQATSTERYSGGVNLFPALSTVAPSEHRSSVLASARSFSERPSWTDNHREDYSSSSRDMELISLLKDVFRDEIDATNTAVTSSGVPHTESQSGIETDKTVTKTYTLLTNTVSPSPSIPMIQSSAYVATALDKISTVPETVSLSPSSPFQYGSSSTYRDTHYTVSGNDVLSPSATAANVIIHSTSVTKTPELLVRTQLTVETSRQESSGSTSAPSFTTQQPQASSRNIAGTSPVRTEVSAAQNPKTQGEKTPEELENERRYKSSMHLVMALVFGLVVLFAVFGVVAKRIYDVWMRRHYHRMDFLIDGLYDGYS